MICLLEYEKGVYHSSACLSPGYRQVTFSLLVLGDEHWRYSEKENKS